MFNYVGLLDMGTPELVLILLIVLLLFGGKKLPELSRSLGQSMKEVKKGFSEAQGAKDDFRTQVAKTATSIDNAGQNRS